MFHEEIIDIMTSFWLFILSLHNDNFLDKSNIACLPTIWQEQKALKVNQNVKNGYWTWNDTVCFCLFDTLLNIWRLSVHLTKEITTYFWPNQIGKKETSEIGTIDVLAFYTTDYFLQCMIVLLGIVFWSLFLQSLIYSQTGN